MNGEIKLMNDNLASSMNMLRNLPDFLLWQLFEKTGRVEYYMAYAEKVHKDN